MSISHREHVWLTGMPFGTVFLMHVSSGAVVTRIRDAAPGGTTAGIGRSCGGRFAALYLDPTDFALYVSSGARRIRIDRSTRAALHRGPLSIRLRLRITSNGHEPLEIQKLMSPRSMLARLLDVPRDGLDHDTDEYLPVVAAVINDPERQTALLRHKDASAGPWDRIES